jgi:3'-phosphoadenosine 5'-phosphosulfate sulfotransferase (PAPS reductase)/FAD synthetase
MGNTNNDLSLRPIHYASVSGGKDSLYMLGLILSNLDKYPLDMVVNFELEIDWPIAKKVTDVIKEKCDKAKIPFVKIKPRKSYAELYEKYGMPNGTARWCNYNYKLDCKKQLEEWIAR